MSGRNEPENVISTLPGFKLAKEIITREQEERLIALVDSCKPQNYAGDALGGLRAISFGWRYDLGTNTFSPCEPMPEGFASLRDIAAQFADVRPQEFVQILLNRYEKGAEIPWHCDKPIWETVIGVSLGSQTTMHFRRPVSGGYVFGTAELAPRSMYLLSGDIRQVFDHSIPPVNETRWSITFRTFSDAGRTLRDGLAPTG